MSHFLGLATVAFAAPLAAQTAYVSNERSSTVSVIDVGSGTVIDTFEVGQRPRGSLSPVSHGQASYFGVGVAAADAFGHGPCRLGGGQALLEGIRRT